MTSEKRSVPITRDMRDFLAEYRGTDGVMRAFCTFAVEAWDAAKPLPKPKATHICNACGERIEYGAHAYGCSADAERAS